MTERSVVLAIFVLTYAGIAVGRVPGLKLDRTGIVLLGAIAVMVFGGIPTARVIGFIHWPTILLLFGFFVLSAQLRLSGFFDAVAARIADRIEDPSRFMLYLMLSTAGLSAFLNHDIVCIAFAPILAVALRKRHLNPAPFLVALAISSNIGAAATIVGNPQDMMIAQVSGLDFGHYAVWCLPPVAFALAAAYCIIWLLSRRQVFQASETSPDATTPAFPLNRPHTIKGLVILAAVILLFFSPLPKELIALTAAGFHLASPKFTTKELLRHIDWPILLLFMGLFVVTGAFEATGYGDAAVTWLNHNGVRLDTLPILTVVTATLSNLINNSAAVMLLLQAPGVAHPPAAFVLALANSFGGSLVVVGSVSNIIVVQQAREMGIDISFREFARLGIPVTLVALAGLIGWELLIS